MLVAERIRIEFADGTHHYRICGGVHHHHLTCPSCRRVVEICACLPEDQFHELGLRTGFAIEGHALRVFGQCPQCRMQARTERMVEERSPT